MRGPENIYILTVPVVVDIISAIDRKVCYASDNYSVSRSEESRLTLSC